MNNNSKVTVIAVAGALAVGVVGSNALADDDDELPGGLNSVKVQQEDREDRRDERKGDDSKSQPARDADDVDVEPRDDDDDDRGDGGDSDSGNSSSVAAAAPAEAPAPAPAPPPAPVYDDYSDDGYSGGSDYGDT